MPEIKLLPNLKHQEVLHGTLTMALLHRRVPPLEDSTAPPPSFPLIASSNSDLKKAEVLLSQIKSHLFLFKNEAVKFGYLLHELTLGSLSPTKSLVLDVLAALTCVSVKTSSVGLVVSMAQVQTWINNKSLLTNIYEYIWGNAVVSVANLFVPVSLAGLNQGADVHLRLIY